MLNEGYLHQIRYRLNGLRFQANDFKIQQTISLNEGTENADCELRITYLFDSDYFFRVLVRFSSSLGSRGEMRPGAYLEAEPLQFGDPGALLEGIDKWLELLQAELDALPTRRLIKEQEDLLASIQDQVDQLPDEYFSREEGERLKAKLEELERMYMEFVHSTEQDEQTRDAKIIILHEDIALLRKSVDSLKKPGWFKALAVRFSSKAADPEVQKQIADVSGTFLGSAIKKLGDGS